MSITSHKGSRVHGGYAFHFLLVLFFLFFNKHAYGLSPDLNKALHQTVLVNKYTSDPKSQWLMHATVRMAKRGVEPVLIKQKIAEISAEYDEQVVINDSKKLPDEGGKREVLYSIMKNAYTSVISASGPLLTVFSGSVFDAAVDVTEKKITASSVERAGEFLANQQAESVIRVGAHVKYITNSYESLDPKYQQLIAEMLVSDVQFEINATDDALLAQNPSIALRLEAQAADQQGQENGRSLLAIYNEIKILPVNSDLSIYKSEIIDVVGSQINEVGASINKSIGDVKLGQQALSNQITDSTNMLGTAIGKNQALLTYVTKDIQAQNDARKKAENAAAIRSEQQAYMHLAALMLDQIDPKFSRAINVTFNASIKINAAVDRLKGLDSFGDIGTAMSIMDIASAAMSIQGLFTATQPSADAIIVDMIAQLQQQVAELRVVMHERFDVVDKKLDDILSAIDSGFMVVQGNSNTNLDAIFLNTAIGLDAQSLILAESQRLSNLIGDFFLIPCVQWRETSNIDMPDDQFFTCTAQMQQYAMNAIKDEQVLYDQNWVDLTFANLLSPDSDQRMTDAVYEEFIIRTGFSRDADKIIDPVQWGLATTWYADFLLEDVLQTQNVIKQNGLQEMIVDANNIIMFKNIVLSTLKVYEPILTNLPAARLVSFKDKLKFNIDNAITDAVDSYHIGKPFRLINLDIEFTQLPSSGVSIEFRETSGFGTQGIVLSSTSLADDLSGALDSVLMTALNHGLGHVTFTNTWISNTTTVVCNVSVFGICIDSEILVTTTTYETHVLYESSTGNGHTFEIGNFTSTFNHSDAEVAGGTANNLYGSGRNNYIGFRTWWGNEILAKTKNMIVSDVSGQYVALENEWNIRRNELAIEIVNQFNNSAIHELDNEIKFENAYFSFLIRFAFSDVIKQSDMLYALATENAGVPKISDMLLMIGADSGQVYSMKGFLDTELSALETYFQSPEFIGLIDSASTHVLLQEAINYLLKAEIVIDNVSAEILATDVDSTDPTTDLPQTTTINVTSGGGSISVYYLLVLSILRLIVGRDAFMKKILH